MSHFVTQIHSIKADRPLTQIRIYFKYHKFITARVYTEYTAASVRNMIWSVLKRWNEYMKFNNGISMLLTDLLRISMLDFCFILKCYSNRCSNFHCEMLFEPLWERIEADSSFIVRTTKQTKFISMKLMNKFGDVR